MNFTFVITTYEDHLKYLNRCLVSLKNINCEYQLIIANNSKSPKSKIKILKAIKNKNIKRYKIIEYTDKTISFLRNKSLKACKTKWISFMDGDDKIHQNFTMNQEYLNKDCDAIFLNNEIARYNIKPCSFYGLKGLIKNDQIKTLAERYLLYPRGNSIITHVWSKIYNREFLFKNNLTFDKKLNVNEDLLFNCQLIVKAKKLFIDKNKKMITHKPSSLKKIFIRHDLEDSSFIRPIETIAKLVSAKKKNRLIKIAKKYWFTKILIIASRKRKFK